MPSRIKCGMTGRHDKKAQADRCDLLHSFTTTTMSVKLPSFERST